VSSKGSLPADASFVQISGHVKIVPDVARMPHLSTSLPHARNEC
jgi:hypothetical protein